MSKVTLAISPCPNDTFIFDAMLHQKIDTLGIEFQVHFADVEELNQAALQAKYDVTKLSYFAYSKVSEAYKLLDSGSALGNNCGPILISKNDFNIEAIEQLNIGIPGKLTTANFLFSLRFPNAINKKFMLFSDIEQQLQDDKIDAGVIIHESRFTYAAKGFKKIIDLGEYWEQTYQAPIPLGGIVVKRNIDQKLQDDINSCIKRSIEYAFANRQSSKDFIKVHAQEMSDDVIQQHIDLYVNQYSISLGEHGINAVRKLYQTAVENNFISPLHQPI